jgi:hypothetical protein
MACAFVHRSDGIVALLVLPYKIAKMKSGGMLLIGWSRWWLLTCYGHMVNTMLTDPPPWTCSYSHNLMCPTGLLI